MRRIIETGNADAIEDDRIQAFISTGRGNTAGLPEIHLHLLDPVTGQEVMAYFFKDDLLAAILDPNPEIKPSEVLGVTLQEPTA